MRSSVVVVFALRCILPFSLLAQGSSARGFDLKGIVSNMSGAPISGAEVSVIGVDAVTKTNDSGRFLIDRLPLGTRVVEFRAIGYAPRYVPVGIGPSTSSMFVAMSRMTILDSIRVTAVNRSEFSRRNDIIGERELSAPDIIGGTALTAVSLLRPQILRAQMPTSLLASNEAAERGQLYGRAVKDSNGRGKDFLMPSELAEMTTAAGSLTVSVNEGPPGSPDVLSVIPVRRIREMRLLRPIEAAARFGPNSAGGPVLLVYTK
jgi:hypothetical protein